MSFELTATSLAAACADKSSAPGIRIFSVLEPVGGPGAPVKPAVYEGGRYQLGRRWATPDDASPTDVVSVDNVPSQANRLEAALYRSRTEAGLPVFELDLSAAGSLPPHLPTTISSLQFPHRNADAYLRDSLVDGVDFLKSAVGKSIIDATPWAAGPLVAWFPQALLFGFWQSHLGSNRAQTKHARAWTSEIIGWSPAATDVRVMGLKGDPLNLNTDDELVSNKQDRSSWMFGKGSVEGGSKDKLSEIGHGQVPFMKESDAAPAGISFLRITQLATVSFAQLRRVGLGGSADADAAARALLVALGLFAHSRAFAGGFSLRSGADLITVSSEMEVLGTPDGQLAAPTRAQTAELLADCVAQAKSAGVPLDGWGCDAVVLTPKENLLKAIASTWPVTD